MFTIPDLLDNSALDRTLSHILNHLLEVGPAVHIATGFSNLGSYALLRDGLQRTSQRQKALVICPAQLRDIWWKPKLDVYRIYAHVESQERVSQSDFPVKEYADADLTQGATEEREAF